MAAPYIFVLVGASGSGKDLLVRAVDDMGACHALIVPKHTSRSRRADDRSEMICPGDDGYDLDGCDIVYENYGDTYGINSARMWETLRTGTSQVVVISNVNAIRQLRSMFGDFLVLVYVCSEASADEFRRDAVRYGGEDYAEKRADEYLLAFDVYLRYFLAFNHVLIYVGLKEDLYDQIFRLFRVYERGDLYRTSARPISSERIWDYSDENDISLSGVTIIE